MGAAEVAVVVVDCTVGDVVRTDMVVVVVLEEEAATAEEEGGAGIADLGLLAFDQAEGGSKAPSEVRS